MLKLIPFIVLVVSCSPKLTGGLVQDAPEAPTRDTVRTVVLETIRDTVVKTVTLTVKEAAPCPESTTEAPKPPKRWQVRKQNKRFRDSLSFELSKLKIELKRQRDTIALLKKQIRPKERTARVVARQGAKTERTEMRQDVKAKRQETRAKRGGVWRNALMLWGFIVLVVIILYGIGYVKKIFSRPRRSDS